MITVKGQKFLTIHAEAGETYEIKYGAAAAHINILNFSGGNIRISTRDEFAESADGAAGQYLTIPDGVSANDISIVFSSVYIKADSGGDIVIERC